MPSAPDASDSADPTLSRTPSVFAVSRFLRALAAQAERDPAFARQLGEALVASGLLSGQTAAPEARRTAPARRGGGRQAGTSAAVRGDAGPSSDPFAVLRAGGEAALRAYLATLEVAALRQLIRQHRLDPARISARWNNRERLGVLIVEQVRARADHGKAFATV